MRLGLDNLISNTKSLLLLALNIFLPKECGNFNILYKRIRYLWHYLLSVYIKGYINRISFAFMRQYSYPNAKYNY